MAFPRPGLSDPAQSVVAVTPNDGTDLPGGICRAIYVGVSGDVSVAAANDSSPAVLKSLAVGWHPIAAKRIYSTNTTATNIVAAY